MANCTDCGRITSNSELIFGRCPVCYKDMQGKPTPTAEDYKKMAMKKDEKIEATTIKSSSRPQSPLAKKVVTTKQGKGRVPAKEIPGKLKTKEAAEILGISVGKLNNDVKIGKIEAEQIDRVNYFNIEYINRIIQERKDKRHAQPVPSKNKKTPVPTPVVPIPVASPVTPPVAPAIQNTQQPKPDHYHQYVSAAIEGLCSTSLPNHLTPDEIGGIAVGIADAVRDRISRKDKNNA